MRGRCSSSVKRVVRSTKVPIAELAKTQDKVSFPMSRYGAVGCFRRTFADHDFGRDEGFASTTRARPRHPERAARCVSRPSVRAATRLDLERTALDRSLHG